METLQRDLSALEVGRAAHVSYRQVDYWTRAGLLRTTRAARGSGTQRRFAQTEVSCARVIAAVLPLLDHFELELLLDAVRGGERGYVLVRRGVIVDLDELCA